MAPQAAKADVFFSVGFAPPAIPVYTQPLCPGDGYIWTPGYWAYTDDGYQWVDGGWVLAPYTGALWTPGYWAFGDNGYFWNAGYWGTNVGYYGGINYGFGYFGTGFYGGYWNHDRFFYNREYNHFDNRGGIRNVYDQRVNGFDGRPGGTSFTRNTVSVTRGSFVNHRNGPGQNAPQSNLRQPFNTTERGNNPVNDTNRNGFVEAAPQSNLRQPQNQSNFRATNNPAEVAGVRTADSGFAANRGGYHQPVQTRTDNSFQRVTAQPAPASNLRQNQGNSSFRSAPAPSRVPSEPAPSAGSFHGGGGGGFHGGGRR